MKKKSDPATKFLIAGLIMPVLGPIIFLVGCEIFYSLMPPTGASDSRLLWAMFNGFKYGAILCIIFIAISWGLRNKETNKTDNQ